MTPTRLKTPFCHSLHVITCQQQGNRLRASENKNINEHEWENWQESKKGIWEREVCSDILPSVVCWEAVHCSTDIKAHASCLSPNPLLWCSSIRFVAYMSTHIHTASPHTSEKLQMCVCVCMQRDLSQQTAVFSSCWGANSMQIFSQAICTEVTLQGTLFVSFVQCRGGHPSCCITAAVMAIIGYQFGKSVKCSPRFNHNDWFHLAITELQFQD